ncbi:hypothetical protein PC116_g11004 [Phytophthora cactorum]|nr:hypothetical protein PC111_g6708 [Phytophthora cactorum]KAG2835094.1 hypothetical protein PC112_g5822 [Phytophthora cactorum]KAG3178353.1 hypothetical protein C6341_g8002 [Phytophthora cactorum]KAG4241041.1 hypothetical protein PC116_g11004 [Phytophthora cactorum]
MTTSRDELGQRQYHDDYIAARPQRGESRQYRVNRALEDAVMMPLMPLLDCLQSDGSLDLSAIPSEYRVVQIGTLSGDRVKMMCTKAAAVIKAKFATPPLMCEKKYFTFPSKPDLSTKNTTASPARVLEGQARHTLFDRLMRIVEESDGPLSGDNLEYLKCELRQNPDLLAMGINSDLWSLFHQAAAGPAHDADLVEWMIQLGALAFQPLHCRYKLQRRNLPFRPEDLPNTMAAHSAAIAGHEDIVRIILEADNMVDQNTPTTATDDGFVTSQTTGNGDAKLQPPLLRLREARQLVKALGIVTDCSVTKAIRAEQLRRSVNAQRDEERRREQENSTNASNTTASKKKKSNKKKSKKGKKGKTTANGPGPGASNPAVTEDDSAEVSNLLKDLLVAAGSEGHADDDSERAALLENTHESTAAIFTRLRDLNIPVNDKADGVQRACKLIEKLKGSVEAFSHPSRLNSTDRRIRIAIASEALQVIHLMQKFHRVDHATVTVPALSSVRKFCDTTLEFMKFVVGTAQLSVSVDGKSQAKEILDPLEKRLVKMPFDKTEPSVYRELVQTYSSARDAMGLGQTASPDTFITLEWYLVNVVGDYELLMAFDKMVGCSMLSAFTTTSDIGVRHFNHFKTAVASAPELNGVGCFNNRILCAARNSDDLMSVLEPLLELARSEGMLFNSEHVSIAMPTMRVGDFTFSEEGVTRGDPAEVQGDDR